MIRIKNVLFAAVLAASGMAQSVFADDIKVRVSGMVCAFCATGIEKKFKGEDSVDAISVDLSQMLIELKTKSEKELSDERITALITSAGYKVTAIERK